MRQTILAISLLAGSVLLACQAPAPDMTSTRPAEPAAAPTPVRPPLVMTVDATTRRDEVAVTSRPASSAPLTSGRPQPAPASAGGRDEYPPPSQAGLVFPVAVMIENSPNARPQSGLAQADVVYDALTEGGISRFLALYMDGTAASIGPVRSTRHYFVYLAAEFSASLVHVGASPVGYDALKSISLRTLDETRGQPGFQRVRGRAAPHNAYTSTDAVRGALGVVRGDPPAGSWGGLRFKDGGGPRASGLETSGLPVEYRPWPYAVRFTYDPATNSYLREMDGAPHREAGGAQLSPTNVVVLTVPARPADDVGRLELEQTGQGKALFLLDGVQIDGTWTKPSETAPTQLRDAAGRPVLLNEGQTWIQIVPPEARLAPIPA